MLLSTQNLTKFFVDKLILKDISVSISLGDRIGLMGVNGAGKTTLLNIIAGELDTDEGVISRSRDLQIGYLKQNDALSGDNTIEQEARLALKNVFKLKKEMQLCAAKMAAHPEDKLLLDEYGKLSFKFEAMDGYDAQMKIDRVLGGLGFGDFGKDTKVATLSGGEKMRFGIAKMLLQEPSLLILDEPTNHLDFSMLAWLEKYLGAYKGAVLVVSHDRYFLDAIAKDIWEIERTRLSQYKGGYSGFVLQKAERRKTAMRQWEQQQEEIAKLEEFVRKNLARSASVNGVGTRVKQLEKMERLEKPAPEQKSVQFHFTYNFEPFSTVLQCEDLGVHVGDEESGKQLFSKVELTVTRGEKIALIGLNGVGKSTFLRAVQEQIPHEGLVRWSGNVRIGYFDQELAGLDLESTVLESVHSRYSTKTEFEIRSILGRYLLEGAAVYKKVKELSGANRAKVAFVILEMLQPNVLLLDEPTNHLDYIAKEALEHCLKTYTGTIITVSHDRYFLRRIPHRILELRPDGFLQYNGNYDYYLEKRHQAEEKLQQIEDAKKMDRTNDSGYRTKEQRAKDAQQRNTQNQLEQEISTLEEKIKHNNDEMQSQENLSDHELLMQLSEEIHSDTKMLEKLGEQWLAFSEEK